MKPALSTVSTIDVLNKILDIDSSIQGKEYLERVAKKVWNAFDIEYVFFGYALKPDNRQVQTVVALVNGELADNFIYDLADTPCQNVFTGKRVCIHPSDVASHYPNDEMLVEMNVESYIGAPTFVDNKLFGLVALLDSSPISDENYYASIVEFISSRISVELERYTHKVEVAHLKKSATIDSLTGLLNRNAFYSVVEKHYAMYKTSSLMFIDVDNFKKFNDTKGHQYGDKVLKHIASSVNLCIREEDLFARFGGEEFVVFLPNTDSSVAQKISERIHAKLKSDDSCDVTISIGLTTKSDLNESIDVLLKRADEAVYKAKELGKDQTYVKIIDS